MAEKTKTESRQFVEVQRFERCPAPGCKAREWHRHQETKDPGEPPRYGAADLLEDKLPPETEPETEPAPSVE